MVVPRLGPTGGRVGHTRNRAQLAVARRGRRVGGRRVGGRRADSSGAALRAGSVTAGGEPGRGRRRHCPSRGRSLVRVVALSESWDCPSRGIVRVVGGRWRSAPCGRGSAGRKAPQAAARPGSGVPCRTEFAAMVSVAVIRRGRLAGALLLVAALRHALSAPAGAYLPGRAIHGPRGRTVQGDGSPHIAFRVAVVRAGWAGRGMIASAREGIRRRRSRSGSSRTTPARRGACTCGAPGSKRRAG